MEREMVNINANLVKEPNFTSFEREDEEVQVVNFTLVKKYGKGKEYINCSAYVEIQLMWDQEEKNIERNPVQWKC